jgi:ubiquinol oxidase
MMLETVAAVPGMVAGAVLHLRSLRRFEQSGGWIRALLEEAENERMHLMTFMEVSQPRWHERALVVAVQGVFFNVYLATYLLSPRVAHRVVGYLEEEAVHSYTEFLRDLDAGKIDDVPAPAIAIDYWRLPAGATLKDVVRVVRADEAHHRDVNHYASVSICYLPLNSAATGRQAAAYCTETSALYICRTYITTGMRCGRYLHRSATTERRHQLAVINMMELVWMQ